MTAVLDAGALIAIDKRDRKVGAILRLLQRDGVPVRTSAAAVAQAWRSGRRQANLARVLRGLDVAAIDETAGKRVGELLGANGTNDLADAHVALLIEPGGSVITSDKPDIEALLRTRGVEATILRV
ncbi:MAG: PIN domain nuclease [Actinomycetota bacterium]|nr:PIN domain nuclease [Actinomycetota bacterium]